MIYNYNTYKHCGCFLQKAFKIICIHIHTYITYYMIYNYNTHKHCGSFLQIAFTIIYVCIYIHTHITSYIATILTSTAVVSCKELCLRLLGSATPFCCMYVYMYVCMFVCMLVYQRDNTQHT